MTGNPRESFWEEKTQIESQMNRDHHPFTFYVTLLCTLSSTGLTSWLFISECPTLCCNYQFKGWIVKKPSSVTMQRYCSPAFIFWGSRSGGKGRKTIYLQSHGADGCRWWLWLAASAVFTLKAHFINTLNQLPLK